VAGWYIGASRFHLLILKTFESNNTQLTTWGKKKTNPTLSNKSMPILKTLVHLPFTVFGVRNPNELYHKKRGKKKSVFYGGP
jgi:hypothetical protein